MNATQRAVLETEAGNLEDAVARAEHQTRKTGRSEDLERYIADARQKIAQLREKLS